MLVAAVRMLLRLVRRIDLLERHTRLVVVVDMESALCHRMRLAVGTRLAQPDHMGLAGVAHRDHVELVVRRSFDRGLVVDMGSAAEDRASGFQPVRMDLVAVVAHKDHAEELLHKLELVGRSYAGRCRRSLGWTCSCRMRSSL